MATTYDYLCIQIMNTVPMTYWSLQCQCYELNSSGCSTTTVVLLALPVPTNPVSHPHLRGVFEKAATPFAGPCADRSLSSQPLRPSFDDSVRPR